jgi:hypothetical protein
MLNDRFGTRQNRGSHFICFIPDSCKCSRAASLSDIDGVAGLNNFRMLSSAVVIEKLLQYFSYFLLHQYLVEPAVTLFVL